MKTANGNDTLSLEKRLRSTHSEAQTLLAPLVKRYGSPRDAFALLSDGYCGACRMHAPQADLYRVLAGTLVQCDCCGRMLYVPAPDTL